MNKTLMVITIIAILLFLFGAFALLQDYIANTLGEWRYMLKCAKERKEIAPDIPYIDEEIQQLEEKIKNYWGNKILLKKRNISMFDELPTPEEEAKQPGRTAEFFNIH